MKLKNGLLLLAMCGFAPAQWLKLPEKGIPRTKDGQPDMAAPAPRKPGGKADLSGIWLADSPKFLQDLTTGLKPGDVMMQSWAEKLTAERRTGAHAGEESDANCLPQGVPKINATPLPFKIIQDPELVVILYEAFGQFRQVFLDGRELPNDPNPTWLGYSVGKWDGDTLVVDSTGFNAKAWLDQAGHPATEALHVTERFHRRDFGHLDLQVTIEDPKVYAKPWTVTQPMHLLADTDLLEFVCNENEKDIRHLNAK
jgi:hypothetical protein